MPSLEPSGPCREDGFETVRLPVEGEDGRVDVRFRQRRRSGVRRNGREGIRADRQGRLPLRGPGDEASALGREDPHPVRDQEGSRPQALRGQTSARLNPILRLDSAVAGSSARLLKHLFR